MKQIEHILTVRIYDDLQAVRDAQAKYEKFKDEEVKSEHFYQKISDQYGKKFPAHIKNLIVRITACLKL